MRQVACREFETRRSGRVQWIELLRIQADSRSWIGGPAVGRSNATLTKLSTIDYNGVGGFMPKSRKIMTSLLGCHWGDPRATFNGSSAR
jgi:hypothetical protein